MERTQPDPPAEAPPPLARYGRSQAHAQGQVRTMLGEIADRLERIRPDHVMTPTARAAVLQAATMAPALSPALRQAAPEITGTMTRAEYAAALRTMLRVSEPGAPATDGTPTNDSDAALHWAAVALGLAKAHALHGNPLAGTDLEAYEQYQDAARAHGHTDEQIRAYAQALPRRAAQDGGEQQ